MLKHPSENESSLLLWRVSASQALRASTMIGPSDRAYMFPHKPAFDGDVKDGLLSGT